MRSNARRNRERILEVALEALAADAGASINSIAKEAGVGIATLYRHFPTREALVLEVYRLDVRQVADAAERLLAEKPPLEAFEAWALRLSKYAMTKHGLGDALSEAARGHAAKMDDHEAYVPVIGALGLLLRACEDAGVVRPGIDPDDVLLAMTGLFRMNPRSRWQPQAKRLIDLLVRGLVPPATA
jgi:AcrR family transcriptional regulator